MPINTLNVLETVVAWLWSDEQENCRVLVIENSDSWPRDAPHADPANGRRKMLLGLKRRAEATAAQKHAAAPPAA